MACKNDTTWFETASAVKDECITWGYLLTLRFVYNDIWDLLKIEDRQKQFKYGYIDDEEDGQREQIEGLADIEGYFSVRFNTDTGNFDSIYFRINGGGIRQRIEDTAGKYLYNNGVNTKKFSPWIVLLKDPCFGCTVFQYDHVDIPYPRGITCGGQNIYDIDDTDANNYNARCIWSHITCNNIPGDNPMEDGLCHIDIDWKEENGNNNNTQNKIGDTAKNLFPSTICVDLANDPGCHYLITWCCEQAAFGHYTELGVMCQEPTQLGPGFVERKLKWVSMGVGDASGIESPQPQSWDYYKSRNSFQGHVTQIIRAAHLTDMISKLESALGGKKNRQCSQKKCGWDEEGNISEVWINDESISFDDIKKRLKTEGGGPSACDKCDKPATSSPICACEWNDLEKLMNEYLWSACECKGNSTYVGETCIGMGDLKDCNCCETRCCCDCVCEDNITEEECLKKECTKNGPKWAGIYEKGESKEDEKIGTAQPCGCYEGGDPKSDSKCLETCGIVSACCPKLGDGCDCWEVTKCQCDAVNGRWQGYRTPTTDGGEISKNCSDKDVMAISGCILGGLQSFGKGRGGKSSKDICNTCGDSSSDGAGSISGDGEYDCHWGVDDRGYVQIAGQSYEWTASGYGCACFGAGGGVAKGLQLKTGDSVSGFAESAAGNVGWSVVCSCPAPSYSPYNLDASGN